MVLRPIPLILATAAALSGAAAQAAELTGTWQVKSAVANPLCHLTQTGDVVRGDCEGPSAKGPAFGILDGQTLRLSWQWVGKDNGVDGAFDFLGKVGPDGALNGELIGMDDATARGPFSATRQATAK